MQELWQLYDEDGNPIPGKAASKDDVYKGLLHGAAHVWIWRRLNGKLEILVQKRAPDKHTWPSLLDVSAAGHIDADESPLAAAVRETQEEIGLNIGEQDLKLISRLRGYMKAPGGSIENEFRWIYEFELKNNPTWKFADREVEAVIWKPFDVFQQELLNNSEEELYVPQPDPYFQVLTDYFKNLV